MTLIKSISGFRGTIGGKPDNGLTPIDIVKLTSSFICLIRRSGVKRPRIVVGRDGRISGTMVNQLVCGALQGMGADVIDIGLSTTPTVEVAVTEMKADGGVILTASHNPRQWNALKLLNNKGEFISKADGEWLLEKAAADDYEFSNIDEIGTYSLENEWIERHVDMVCNLPLVNKDIIAKANLKVVVDAVNSTGGIAIPMLLRKLGVTDIVELNCEVTGEFAHNPEPLAVNLVETCAKVKEVGADFGIVVDPDVDRLAFIDGKGEMDGEEYTLSEELETHDAVLINFWYTTCAWCLEEFPELEKAYQNYSDDISIITLSQRDMNPVIDDFKYDNELSFPMANDTTQYSLFGVTGCPTTVIIDRYGLKNSKPSECLEFFKYSFKNTSYPNKKYNKAIKLLDDFYILKDIKDISKISLISEK